jgi:hypothetical protein
MELKKLLNELLYQTTTNEFESASTKERAVMLNIPSWKYHNLISHLTKLNKIKSKNGKIKILDPTPVTDTEVDTLFTKPRSAKLKKSKPAPMESILTAPISIPIQQEETTCLSLTIMGSPKQIAELFNRIGGRS